MKKSVSVSNLEKMAGFSKTAEGSCGKVAGVGKAFCGVYCRGRLQSHEEKREHEGGETGNG
jgi:hypothetical protein